ncbi:MAG: HrpE/YscL family type III secretion apparatus protein [Chlamydiia bacterium]|nr:HrpE/YscL family type III secretion apparatus protein [Chlamydiia bacterium]
MSKKLFTLIKGGEIHVEPETKIIPKDKLGAVISSEEVLQTIKEDARKYRKDVADEIETIKAKAKKDGYQDGFKEWAEAIARLEHEIKSIRKEYEKILVPVALKSVEKILGRELESNENTIMDILKSTLKAVSTHKKITLYVSPKEKGVVEKNKEELKKLFEVLEVFQIREREDIEPGGSVIETEGGIINAQVSNQLEILERAFKKLFTPKDAAK